MALINASDNLADSLGFLVECAQPEINSSQNQVISAAASVDSNFSIDEEDGEIGLIQAQGEGNNVVFLRHQQNRETNPSDAMMIDQIIRPPPMCGPFGQQPASAFVEQQRAINKPKSQGNDLVLQALLRMSGQMATRNDITIIGNEIRQDLGNQITTLDNNMAAIKGDMTTVKNNVIALDGQMAIVTKKMTDISSEVITINSKITDEVVSKIMANSQEILEL